jgi:ABC-type polysaccharide/polyol phosphate transport system ATPase subunit
MIRNQCDEVMWLDKGKVIEYGNTEETLDHYLDFMHARKSN